MSPRLAAVACALLTVGAGCSSAPEPVDAEPTATTTDAITTTDAVSRAGQWVQAKLDYCQSPYGQPDPDQACPSVCWRQSNPQWNPYRSDCSGLISWAWGLPAPGRVTWEFAPYQTDVSHVIQASDLRAGDACNKTPDGHIVLFKQWVTPGKRATFIEEPGCSVAQPYAHEFTSDVTLNGTKLTLAYSGETFYAIRYDAITLPDAPARGALDAASCKDGIGGWAQDTDSASKALTVKLDFGAVDLKVLAAEHRDDLCKAIGSCNHGFSLGAPVSLMDGKAHAVHALAVDAQTGAATELHGSPKSFTCAPPAIPAGVKRWVPSTTVLEAWSFDEFAQLAHEPQSSADAIARGADLPAKPLAVIADDGSPEVWVVDAAARRHVVSPASLRAWKLAATKWTAAKVNALPQGPDWPAAPFLFKGAAQPDVFVIDVAPAAPPKPDAGSATGGGSGDDGGSAGWGDDRSADTGAASGCSASAGRAGDASWLAGMAAGLAVLGIRARRRAET